MSLESLKRRVELLAAAGLHQQCDFKKDEQAINAIITDVWPTFDQDNPDLLASSGEGVSRCFADPRYREIEKRVYALMQTGGN